MYLSHEFPPKKVQDSWRPELTVIPAEFPNSAPTGFQLHGDPQFEIDPRGCLKCIAEFRTVLVEVDLPGPVVTIIEIILRVLASSYPH